MIFLTDTQVVRLCKAFANGSSANIKLLKTQVSKILQSSGFLLPILLAAFKVGAELVERGALIWAKNTTKYFMTKGITELNKIMKRL